MKSRKVLLGVLGGVAAGAIAGILFAPAKGSKTRRRIVDTGKGYAKDATEKMGMVAQDFSDTYDTILHDAKELISDHQAK